jgi:gluconate 2-dehydrogenase gamma chain
MDRREALIRVAGLMGGTLVYAAGEGAWAALSSTTAEPSFLGVSQSAVVSGVVDVMIPRTDTPGALDVGVPAFIDLMLKDVYTREDRDRYLAGLADFDAAASSEHGVAFVALEVMQQVALVRKFHDKAVHEESQRREAHAHLQRPFILMTKELALLRFFTSQVGATRVLQYVAVPGSYHGCLPLQQAGNGKTWAVAPGIEF